MASRYVPCRDLEHALEMHDAGLLHARWHVGWFPTRDPELHWEQHGIKSFYIKSFYNKSGWPAEDWAVLVEEDGSPNGEN